MPRDVATRWNSTFVLLKFALEYREAIDLFTADKGNDVRQYEMDDEEWEIAEELRDVLQVSIEPSAPSLIRVADLDAVSHISNPPLSQRPQHPPLCPTLLLSHLCQVFFDATQFFSRGGTPALPTVIPAMDRIDEFLTGHSLDKTLKPPVAAMCKLAKDTLNRYYAKTDYSDAYRIAMSTLLPFVFHDSWLSCNLVLHPRHKAEYFKQAKWTDRRLDQDRERNHTRPVQGEVRAACCAWCARDGGSPCTTGVCRLC